MPLLTNPVDGSEILEKALNATGLTTAQLARLLDVNPGTVFRWRNGGKMRLWIRDILERACEMPPSRRGELYLLMNEDRNIDALALILGAPRMAA